MLETLFTFLSGALADNWYIAFAGAFIWGVMSVVLSPCHIGSIPLIVAYINGQGKISFKRAFVISAVFSLGILFSIMLIGLITGLSGRILGNIGMIGLVLIPLVFVIVGLHFIGIVPLPIIGGLDRRTPGQHSFLSGFGLGFIYGLALGPCSFAFMTPILAIVFDSSSHQFVFAMALISLYALGHCMVFVLFGVSSELVQRFLNWDEKSRGTLVFRKAIGVIMILSGIYFVFNAVFPIRM